MGLGFIGFEWTNPHRSQLNPITSHPSFFSDTQESDEDEDEWYISNQLDSLLCLLEHGTPAVKAAAAGLVLSYGPSERFRCLILAENVLLPLADLLEHGDELGKRRASAAIALLLRIGKRGHETALRASGTGPLLRIIEFGSPNSALGALRVLDTVTGDYPDYPRLIGADLATALVGIADRGRPSSTAVLTALNLIGTFLERSKANQAVVLAAGGAPVVFRLLEAAVEGRLEVEGNRMNLKTITP